MDIKGRVALITGSAGHLGSVIAETLAELGVNLILVDRPEVDFSLLAESLRVTWGVNICEYACDLEQHDDRNCLIDLVKEEHASIDILVNNAAFVGGTDLEGWSTSFENQTVETWRRGLEVNLTAPFHICQGLALLLKRSKSASIINVGSIYGQYAPDWSLYEGTEMSNPAAYSASKAGLMQLTRWLATTLAPEVRANAIAPGGINRNLPREFVNRYESRTPLKRMAREDDFRGAFAYLASDLSSYVTGQILFVDGGWGIW